MRFLTFIRSVESDAPPSAQEEAAMGQLIDEWAKAGVLLAAEGCLPSARGSRVRRSGERYTVTDGPFTESKEVIGGFAIIQGESRREAIEWSKRFLAVAGDGECEIRELYDMPAYAPGP